MNDIQEQQHNSIDYGPNHSLAFLLDEQYMMDDVNRIIADRQNKADQIISKIMSLVSDAKMGESCHNAHAKETKYVVQIGDRIQESLNSGKVKLVKNDSGELFAQMRESNGHYGSKLPIRPEEIARGLDPNTLITYLQMKSIEKQLKDVVSALGEIGNKVNDVVRGQQNDRLALYYSGLNMYYEAEHINNEALQIGLIAQALQSINEANAQVMKELKDNTSYIVNKCYLSTNDRKKRLRAIDEKMNSINQCFDVIHRSAVIKAMIYYERGELDAMLAVVEEYGKFIEKMIRPYAGILSEHDKNDVYLKDGIWESKVNTLLSMNNLRIVAKNREEFYFDIKEATDE